MSRGFVVIADKEYPVDMCFSCFSLLVSLSVCLSLSPISIVYLHLNLHLCLSASFSPLYHHLCTAHVTVKPSGGAKLNESNRCVCRALMVGM